MITATHYLVLSLVMFSIGLVGVMVRRNLITVLMSLALLFSAVNLNLVAFSCRLGDLSGQVLAVLVITVVAAKAVIGLGLVVAFVRLKGSVSLDRANDMRS